MNLFKISVSSCCLLLTLWSHAQSLDSTQHLGVVEVATSRISKYSSGNKTETIDSAILNQYEGTNLADVLVNESQIFIKSYGLGSLATTSFRGASASHTAVLWNGFNIQSPTNGLLDMSLVPVNFLNDVKLQYGGAGALWGSSAVGGSIHLNNTNTFNKGISITSNSSIGSFFDRQQQATVEVSKKKFITSLKVFNHDAKNDFTFINTAQYGKPEQKQSNAELKQYGLLQENYFQINRSQKLNTRFWYQFNDRNIPPAMTEAKSVANQKDEFYRVTSEWQRTGDKLTSIVRAAYFAERLFFNDSAFGIDSRTKTKVLIVESDQQFHITKYDRVSVGINNTYSEAQNTEFIFSPVQNRFSIFASYKIQNPNNTFNTSFNLRQEFIDARMIPFVPAWGVEAKLFKFFSLKTNIARHYRVPTFNDLYWAQGGNPDLRPENGWSEELSLLNKYAAKKINWELSVTAFNRNVDDWIIWLPNNYATWSPVNKLKVWSRGLEYKMNGEFILGELRLKLSGMYNYVLSTNEKVDHSDYSSLHKQLIYVPIQNGQGHFSIHYKGFSFSYSQLYTGYRYTLSDNTAYLNSYTIANINISKVFSLNTSKVKVSVQFNNIWKETYQVLAYRPMPLFNYQFGLSFYFNEK